MAPDVEELLRTAKTLGHDQIADLAFELLRVLDGDAPEPDPAEVDAVWRAEYRRRIDDLRSGAVQAVDHDETVAQVKALLAERRR